MAPSLPHGSGCLQVAINQWCGQPSGIKRSPAVSTDLLLRDVASLDDSVLLLPQQVVIFTDICRPLDILAYLHLENDQAQDVACLPMTLREYFSGMSAYLAGVDAQLSTENLVSERTRRAMGTSLAQKPPVGRTAGMALDRDRHPSSNALNVAPAIG